MTRYNNKKKTKKNYVEKDIKQENDNGNLFKNLPIFLEKMHKFLLNRADPEIWSYMGYFVHKEGQSRLKLALQPNFLLKIS